MKNKHGNYAQHAQYWDWGSLDHDRTPEDDADYNFAKQYGNNILIPMCAWGHLGAYMAERGMNVTAFDITPEMIDEGKKRFGDITNLNLFVGDARDFKFDIEPVDVCSFADWGHIHTLDEIKKALVCINKHLKTGGYFLFDEHLSVDDNDSEPRTFRVENNPYPDRVVYKTTNVSREESATRRWYCYQTMYIEYNDGRKEQFNHEFYMQSYTREEWLEALHESGFEVKAEYKNREKEPWTAGCDDWIVEAVKK
jgi:SAM-dependent methyltransferase